MEKPIFQATLCESDLITLGVITISFPLTPEEYDHSISLLTEQHMGDPVHQDCFVDTITSAWPALKCLEGQYVNVDELDYLAKRLDSFSEGEDIQYLAMADKLKLTNIKDLINLTFCCQQVTVISDFSKLEEAGREHYMNLNDGCASKEELDNLDGEETAWLLIESGRGIITPYGVVYDNGMELEPLYAGKAFPAYAYDVVQMELQVSPIGDPQNTVWLGLPMLPSQIERTLQRCGMGNVRNFHIEAVPAMLPKDVLESLNLDYEGIYNLNEMCTSIGKLALSELNKLRAAIKLAKPEGALQICQLADSLDLFDFVAGVKDATQLGGYMIAQSGHFDYDPNLDEYYDFEKYGREMLERESGCFTSEGYISYQGTMPLENLMMLQSLQQQEQAPSPSSQFLGQQMC
jgi:hypothetical protein